MATSRKKSEEKVDDIAQKVITKKNSWRTRLALLGTSLERDYLIENLSLLIASGIDLLSAFSAIKGGMKTKKMRLIIDDLSNEVQDGIPLWRALENSKLLSPQTLYLVRLGEETGKLSQNLKVIVLQLNKDRDFRSKLRQAMMYPVIVLSVTVIVAVSIAWFVLPRLSLVFRQLDLELPFITRVLIQLGDFLKLYGWFVVPIAIFLSCIAFYYLFFHSKTKFIGQDILFVLPGIRKIIVEVELARFGFILGTLLESGIQVTTAVNSLYEGTGFDKYKKLYWFLHNALSEGYSFQKSFSMYEDCEKLIPIPIQQMIISAERSGKLSQTCFKIGDTFEQKTEISTKNLSIVLEPVLLVIIWLMVLMVALAVILPLYNLIGGLNK